MATHTSTTNSSGDEAPPMDKRLRKVASSGDLGSMKGIEAPPMNKRLRKVASCGDLRSMKDVASKDPSILLGKTSRGGEEAPRIDKRLLKEASCGDTRSMKDMASEDSSRFTPEGGQEVPLMDQELLKEDISGDSPSMQAMVLQGPSILLGTTRHGGEEAQLMDKRLLNEASCSVSWFMKDMISEDSSSLAGTTSQRGEEAPLMDKKLLEAAKSGDSLSMQAMAEHDLSILLRKTLQGNTCLHICSSHGEERFSRDVLQLEESLLTVVNLDEETALIAGVRNAHVSLASFLLRRCCQTAFRKAILQQDKYGFNALHYAIRNGHKDLALELTEVEPALSQAVSKRNESPLFFALTRNFTHVYKKLVENPSCAYSGGLDGWNCLHAAVTNGDQEIARIIMEKCPELARQSENRTQCTPVVLAVLYGKIDMLRVMLKHDSTLGYRVDNNGSSLLTAAAFRGQVASAQEVLEHCPDAPYYNDIEVETLLHVAVWSDQAEFVEFVLKTPILRKLVNMQDKDGATALHIAVKKCNKKIVVPLLSHEDIDVTVLDNLGDTASMALQSIMQNAKTLNWNEVNMLMSKAHPQGAPSLHILHLQAKEHTTSASRNDAKALTKTYASNTSLVAILIATITFAAAFTLPGGYSSDAGSEGLPIMSKKFAFQVFLISDVLAMCSSFAVAFICIIARWEDYEFLLYYRSFTKKLMWFAYVATTTAFSTGLYTVLDSRLHWLAIAICGLVALLPIVTWLLGKWPVLKLRFRLGKSFRSDFLDMV